MLLLFRQKTLFHLLIFYRSFAVKTKGIYCLTTADNGFISEKICEEEGVETGEERKEVNMTDKTEVGPNYTRDSWIAAHQHGSLPKR